MLLALVTAALAQDPASDEPEPVDESHVRLYLGGGSAQTQGSVGQAAELGAHWVRMGGLVGSELGGGLSFYRAGNVSLPVLNLDAAGRIQPRADWTLEPYATAGLGVSVLIIIPFPSVSVGLGLELDLGVEVKLDATLRGRWIADPYGQSEGVTVQTLELGLGF